MKIVSDCIIDNLYYYCSNVSIAHDDEQQGVTFPVKTPEDECHIRLYTSIHAVTSGSYGSSSEYLHGSFLKMFSIESQSVTQITEKRP